ncbi:MAG: T9SS type A sorting domain-containing protein [Bacteroidetes bacterium]|nr:T9SS type A sorting domain-containing protein [Bacteroidota bacterium]
MKYIFCLLISCTTLFSQTWTQLTDLPGAARDDGFGSVNNGAAYFGTGSNGSFIENSFYKLDLSTNTWTTLTSMPAASNRQYASAFAFSNYIFVAGGLGNAGAVFSDTYRYDIAAGTWSLVAPKPGNAVWGASSFTLGSKGYLVGGKFTNSVGSDEVWEYDMIANTWLQKSNFPFGARWRAAASVLNNVPYLVFGLDNTGTGAFRKEMYKYLPGTDTWVKLADFPQPYKGRIYSAMQALNNKLVIFGGYDTLGTFFNDCWFFDETNGFVQGPSMPATVRKGGMSAALGNKFYYTCGISGSNIRLKETWMLDVPVGIKENFKGELFSVYPNPCSGTLSIKQTNEHQIQAIELSEATGKKIFIKEKVQGQIDLSFLSPGMYFLRITNSEGASEVKKIIKD